MSVILLKARMGIYVVYMRDLSKSSRSKTDFGSWIISETGS